MSLEDDIQFVEQAVDAACCNEGANAVIGPAWERIKAALVDFESCKACDAYALAEIPTTEQAVEREEARQAARSRDAMQHEWERMRHEWERVYTALDRIRAALEPAGDSEAELDEYVERAGVPMAKQAVEREEARQAAEDLPKQVCDAFKRGAHCACDTCCLCAFNDHCQSIGRIGQSIGLDNDPADARPDIICHTEQLNSSDPPHPGGIVDEKADDECTQCAGSGYCHRCAGTGKESVRLARKQARLT